MKAEKHDRKRRNAILRLLAGETKVEDEAARLNLNKRTLERDLAAARKVRETAGTPDQDVAETAEGPVMSETVAPLEAKAPEKPSEALAAALEAVGEAPAAPAAKVLSALPTPLETRLAVDDMKDEVIQAYRDYRGMVGETMVQFLYAPHLKLDDPEVQKILEPSKTAIMALRENAARLHPYTVKILQGWGPLAVLLGRDVLFCLFFGLEARAREKGWKPKGKAPKPLFDRADARRRQADLEAGMEDATTGDPEATGGRQAPTG